MAFLKRKHYKDINPDEIFLDASNLPEFDQHQFEGRIEKPLTKYPFITVGIFVAIIFIVFFYRVADLQVVRGDEFKRAALNNRLESTIIFNERGIIRDRNGLVLAKNVSNILDDGFSLRQYAYTEGLAHVLGYVDYPAKDAAGNFYQEEFEGKDGVEEYYNDLLSGSYGKKIVETDALGGRQSESFLRMPVDGEDITLSIDSRVSSALYSFVESLSHQIGFEGGAGVILDVRTGEIIVLTNYPEYTPNTLTAGNDRQSIKQMLADERKPFLNRSVSGLFTPGSIVKPFIALAALNENIITPSEKIVSTGSISVPHPYIPGEESVFYDWKAHGPVDMKEAIAYSSNVYFYEIGGGYEEQKGLGIGRIEQYMRLFGFEKEPGVDLYGEKLGVIPTPAWKEEVFKDEWRLGDTYNTVIGQYGFQVTPLQVARGMAALANSGVLITPRLVLDADARKLSRKKEQRIKIPKEYFSIVKEGLRDAVLYGTASRLNLPQVEIAAKTGTAEVGISKKRVHSWVTGFFPYENPRYAFAVVMEKGPRENTIGALFVMRQLLEWMSVETPEYLETDMF